MQQLISELYNKGEVPKKKMKQRKWKKGPKISVKILNEAAHQIQEWNRRGTLASLPKLEKWLKEEKQLDVGYDHLQHYVQKMGFKWMEMKKKGKLFESPRVQEWQQRYINRRVVEWAEGRQWPMYYLDKTYMHQNYAPNYLWCLKVEGNAVGTPAGKGQCLILQHAGREQGWIAGVEQVWVVWKGLKLADYHNNVNHATFIHWFKKKVCCTLPKPLTFIMDNAAYHKVKQLTDEEKSIFDGQTFSKLTKAQLQHYLTAHQAEWGANLKHNKLYNLAHTIYDEAPPAISEIAKRYGHEILFLPPYHSNFNPIKNIWGIVKGYIAHHHTTFTTAEIMRLTQEGVAHVTPEMWKKAIKKVEEMEEELYLDDISDEIQ